MGELCFVKFSLTECPWTFTEDKSTLVQVMAWCHQATSHYLSQCLPRSVLSYGLIRLQWVNINNMYCDIHGIFQGNYIMVKQAELLVTLGTPQLTLLGKLQGIYFDYFAENGPCYNDTALQYVSLCGDARENNTIMLHVTQPCNCLKRPSVWKVPIAIITFNFPSQRHSMGFDIKNYYVLIMEVKVVWHHCKNNVFFKIFKIIWLSIWHFKIYFLNFKACWSNKKPVKIVQTEAKFSELYSVISICIIVI